MSDKIVNTFQARRQLTEDMNALSATQSEAELLSRVRAIAQNYEPLLVLSTLTKYLDHSSSQVRGGLGRLATLLPYDETVIVLRKEAANRGNPTQTRITAAMILERFLEAEIAPGLMSDLKDPETVVMQSLQEALAESHENHSILLEYVRQMRQENEQVAHQVMELLGRLNEADRPELLRLIAYDMRESVALAALERLGAIRQGEAAQSAARALYTLQHNLKPDLAQTAERSLRKLRFLGVRYEPVSEEGWQALITPSTLDGSQDLWFLRRGMDASQNLLIGLRINASAGLLDAFGSEAIESQYLPAPRSVGEMVSIALTSGPPTVFLEVPLGYARWRLEEAVAAHWRQSKPRPLPEEYTFYNSPLSLTGKAELPAQLGELLGSGPGLWKKNHAQLEEIGATLLRHPAMAGWFFQNSRMLVAAARLSAKDEPAFRSTLATLKRELFTAQVEQALGVETQAGLLAQAAWLSIAGHPQHAQHAVLLAEGFNHTAAADHPLVEMMLEIGLLLLMKRRGKSEE